MKIWKYLKILGMIGNVIICLKGGEWTQMNCGKNT